MIVKYFIGNVWLHMDINLDLLIIFMKNELHRYLGGKSKQN